MIALSEEGSPIPRAGTDERAAFTALFEQHERRIYLFIYRMMGNADDAADLTQETFLRAYRALDRTDEALNVGAWLHRIAANACFDALRRRRRIRWVPWEGTGDDAPAGRREEDPQELLLGGETQRLVQDTLLALSPRYRQALILREYEGLSCEEIGAIMGVSGGAAKMLLFRGREEFRRRYRALTGEGGQAG